MTSVVKKTMTKKDKDKKDIIKFPTLAERDRIRKKQAQEKEFRKDYKASKTGSSEPFFKFGNIPPFTLAISAIFVFIHIITNLALDFTTKGALINTLSFIPQTITSSGQWTVFTPFTPLTYNFLHAGWVDLGFNILMGLALGTFVEKMFSTKTTIKFYFLCGIGGAAAFFLFNPNTATPLIGASPAISGLFAATLLMMVESGRLGPLTGKFANKGPWPIIFIWVGIMIFIGLVFGGTTWQAHLAGFLTGAGLYHFMRKEKLRL